MAGRGDRISATTKTLPVPLSFEPMEAVSATELPQGPGWHFEPKWDGFRCLVFKDGPALRMQSRNQRPLERYFPELVAAFLRWRVPRFVLDGELIVPGRAFDALQMRLHPAQSRIEALSRSHPAAFVAFDCLVDSRGGDLRDLPFARRRKALKRLIGPGGKRAGGIRLSPATTDREEARAWLAADTARFDGIVAKQCDEPYRPGERVMIKYKVWQTVDCVVAGLYRRRGQDEMEYLLLGLYDRAGLLHYVGRAAARGIDPAFLAAVERRTGGGGFTGKAPGGKSRWSDRVRVAIPVRPDLVVEVEADRVENGRFRHGARVLRVREDKKPRQCLIDQLLQAESSEATLPIGPRTQTAHREPA